MSLKPFSQPFHSPFTSINGTAHPPHPPPHDLKTRHPYFGFPTTSTATPTAAAGPAPPPHPPMLPAFRSPPLAATPTAAPAIKRVASTPSFQNLVRHGLPHVPAPGAPPTHPPRVAHPRIAASDKSKLKSNLPKVSDEASSKARRQRKLGLSSKEEEEEYEKLKLQRQQFEKDEMETKKSLTDDFLKGVCQTMCSRFEYLTRCVQQDIHPLEMENGEPCFDKFVKKYQRSYAGASQHPEDLRPLQTLLRSQNYLLGLIRTQPLPRIYSFIWDRFRAIRRDISTQQIVDPAVATIYEQIIRFHLICLFLRPPDLDRFQELTQLNAALSDLLYLYQQGISSPNEIEFLCYDTLLYINDAAKRRRLFDKAEAHRQNAFLEGTRVLLPLMGISDHKAKSHDFAHYIRALHHVPLGLALVASLHLDRIRRNVLFEMVFTGYHREGRTATKASVADLTEALHFQNEAQCVQFVTYFGVPFENHLFEFGVKNRWNGCNIDLKQPEATKLHPHFLDARLAGGVLNPVDFILGLAPVSATAPLSAPAMVSDPRLGPPATPGFGSTFAAPTMRASVATTGPPGFNGATPSPATRAATAAAPGFNYTAPIPTARAAAAGPGFSYTPPTQGTSAATAPPLGSTFAAVGMGTSTVTASTLLPPPRPAGALQPAAPAPPSTTFPPSPVSSPKSRKRPHSPALPSNPFSSTDDITPTPSMLGPAKKRHLSTGPVPLSRRPEENNEQEPSFISLNHAPNAAPPSAAALMSQLAPISPLAPRPPLNGFSLPPTTAVGVSTGSILKPTFVPPAPPPTLSSRPMIPPQITPSPSLPSLPSSPQVSSVTLKPSVPSSERTVSTFTLPSASSSAEFAKPPTEIDRTRSPAELLALNAKADVFRSKRLCKHAIVLWRRHAMVRFVASAVRFHPSPSSLEALRWRSPEPDHPYLVSRSACFWYCFELVWPSLQKSIYTLQHVQRRHYVPWCVVAATNHVLSVLQRWLDLVLASVGCAVPTDPSHTCTVPLVAAPDASRRLAPRAECLALLTRSLAAVFEIPEPPRYTLSVPFGDLLVPLVHSIVTRCHDQYLRDTDLGMTNITWMREWGQNMQQKLSDFLGDVFVSMDLVCQQLKKDACE